MQSQFNSGNSAGRGKKVLALFPGALGDFICFLPALNRLAEERPVDLLARAEYADLTPPGVHAGSLERREVSRLFAPAAPEPEDAAALARFFAPYERVYSWTGGGDRNFTGRIESAAGERAKVFPFRPAAAPPHISDYYLECVGARAGEALPEVAPRPEALAWGRRWLAERGLGGKKILAVAPGSGAREKNWPREFFRAVEAWWERETGGKCLELRGPVEAERWLDDDGDGVTVARDLTLARAAALLSLADAYIGNDSGVTHLAAAVGVETIALFGPTDPDGWAPRGRRVTVASRRVECSPCARETMKNCPHHKCLTGLMPRQVIELLELPARRRV
ncbi:MAG TPA: glycosyltransferase family 9 protein [Candidatus Binatia bacterium]